MRVYAPQISIKLVKAVKRGDIVPGMPADSERYSKLDAIDLTPFLGDSGSVQVTKGVRDPSGGYNITFRDSLGKDGKGQRLVVDTVSALVEPMDLIEIRFCRDPLVYGAGKWPPVVMRGLVSEVTRVENMNSDQPSRTVTIAGQDFGKVLQIIQIYYLNNSQVGDNILSEWGFFQKYAPSGAAKTTLAKDFAKQVVDGIVDPYLKTLTALANGEPVGAKVINSWTVDATLKGALTPWLICSFQNVSLYQMLSTCFDVGPFNEMFTEDTEDGVKFVIRPNPFLAVDGTPINGNKPEEVKLTDKEIIAMSLSRTDAGVANWYWVVSSRLPFMQNEDAQFLAQSMSPEHFDLRKYLNANAGFYGYRKMEVESALVGEDYAAVEGQKEPDVDDGNSGLTKWLDDRVKVLSDSNKDNVVFEAGTIQCMGDERLKAGRQLVLTRANGQPVTAYITKVQHSFQALQSFTTNLTLERATTFVERAKAKTSQYLPEINARGVK
jgi:hypothetical protein